MPREIQTAICPRCGVTRRVKPERNTATCMDCRKRIPEPTEREALPPGRWTRDRNGVMRFVARATHCHCGARMTGPSCETCLRWAEKDARLHAEAAASWANRGRIWQILDLGKQAA